ncbi:MAG: uridine diphosphate-N-acetylglucosamine-binding protein YvcK [Deinococcales bacterium]
MKKYLFGLWRWFIPGLRVKRYLLLCLVGLVTLVLAFVAWARVGPERNNFINWTARLIEFSESIGLGRWGLMGIGFFGGLLLGLLGIIGLNRSLLGAVGSSPTETLDMIFKRRGLARGPRLVAIGGGTGLSNLLGGLKAYTSNITAIVAVTDDGGSSGRLRAGLDMPAPGDLTDCYAALSDNPELKKLLTHRFSRGDIEGHTFGNLLLATLVEDRANFAEATAAVNQILDVRGTVLPASLESAVMLAHLEDGTHIRGESVLARERQGRKIRRISLEPADLTAPIIALEAVQNAELILLGPGSLYTSLTPPLLVQSLREAIQKSKAKLVYISNIMTEPGETDQMSLLEHVQVIVDHLGRNPDVVFVNSAKVLPALLENYQRSGAEPIKLDVAALQTRGIAVISTTLTREGKAQHDPKRLARALMTYAAKQRAKNPLSFYFE